MTQDERMLAKAYDAFVAACSVLVSSTFAFLLALFTAYLLNMTVNPVTLSEALPFLVVVVGFEKPFILARSVFANPAFDPREPLSTSRPDIFETLASGSSAHDRRSVNSSTGGFDEQHTFPVAPPRERVAMKPARDIVVHAVNRHGHLDRQREGHAGVFRHDLVSHQTADERRRAHDEGQASTRDDEALAERPVRSELPWSARRPGSAGDAPRALSRRDRPPQE